MSEKRFKLKISSFSDDHMKFMNIEDNGKRIKLEEIVDKLNELYDENEKLRQQLQEKQEDEKLYAQEILELNKTKKEMLNFKQLGGDY